MKKDKAIDIAIKSNELVENLKSSILSNVIVKIKDSETKELLWCCHTDETYGRFKNENLEIEQDINLYVILDELKKFLK